MNADETLFAIREFCESERAFILGIYGLAGPSGYLGFANACEDILKIIDQWDGGRP